MKISMVVFDMAGTSVDEGNVVYHTLHKAIEKQCPSITFEDVLKWGAGKEKLQAIRETLAESHITLNEQSIQEIFKDFLLLLDKAYENLIVVPTKNTERLFQELRDMGIKVVLNTGYNHATASLLIQKLNWELGQHYDLLVTASNVTKNRPNPDMILLAMEKLNILDAASVIKVGILLLILKRAAMRDVYIILVSLLVHILRLNYQQPILIIYLIIYMI